MPSGQLEKGIEGLDMPAGFSRRDLLRGALGAAFASPAAALAIAPGNDFELTRTDLNVPGLDPAHEGLVIAQLSDVHVGWQTPDARIRAAIAAVNRLGPDLVALTGDFVTWDRDPLPHLPDVLRGLEAPTYACLGNHDHIVDAAVVRRHLEGLGYAVLQNEHTVVQARGAPLSIVGVDDGATRHDDVRRSFQGVRPGGTRLVLTHSPPTAAKLPPDCGLVCLAGHTHGGGVVIPELTLSMFFLVGQPYLRGLYQVRANLLYVNRGLGFGTTPLSPRIGSDPEVSVFALHSA